MGRLKLIAGAVVVSTVLFLCLNNYNLRNDLKVVNSRLAVVEEEKERAIIELKQVREDLKNVQIIKAINANNPIDIYERLRSKGYLRSE